jgi:lipopolysaccharide assembly protein A
MMKSLRRPTSAKRALGLNAAPAAAVPGGSSPNVSRSAGGAPLRFVFLLILLVALAAVVVFAVQNNEAVTLRYLDRSITCALPPLVAGVYLVGMVSGWTVLGLLRRSLRRGTERRED